MRERIELPNIAYDQQTENCYMPLIILTELATFKLSNSDPYEYLRITVDDKI